ncbi:hypothetical protein [Caenispirillum salinarum]|uniref:hypothetical protein n=1 Tax=Caenispirillum salinarum TaxID=859058 RepID=UPI00384E6981
MGRSAAALLLVIATAALSGCSTVEQILPMGNQTLTVTPNGGAAYEGRCIVRGQEPVIIEGTSEQSWELGEGVDCRIVQQGDGSLSAVLTGPSGLVSRSETTGDGAFISIAQQ